MAKSKSKSKATNQKKVVPAKKKTTAKKKAPPPVKFLTCGETGERVFVTTATLKDIQHPPTASQNKRKVLFKVPSAKTRTTLYDELALCLEDCESRRLPKYGGRPWSVMVKVTDNSQLKTSPFFRWYRSKLELAVLPHLLEKIPEPPKFPGYEQTDHGVVRKGDYGKEGADEEEEEYDMSDPEVQRMESLLSREVSALSQVAWDHRNDGRLGAPLPTVSLKWTCPLRQIFTSRKAAWDHALELAKAEQFVDRYLHGLGKNGAPLKPFRPTKQQTLQAGKVRFLRDGLWVVGQEQEWQNERYLSMERGDETEIEPPVQKRRKITGSMLFLSTHREAYREKRLKDLKRKGGSETKSDEDNNNNNSSLSKTSAKVGMPTPQKKKPAKNLKINFSLMDSDRELRGIWKNKLTHAERNSWDTKAIASFQRKLDEDDQKRWDLAAKQQEEEEEEEEEEESGEEEKQEDGCGEEGGEGSASKETPGQGEEDDDDEVELASANDRDVWEVFSDAEQALWKKGASKTVKYLGEGEEKKPSATNSHSRFPDFDAYQERVFRSFFDMTPKEYEESVLKNMRVADRRRQQKEHQKQKELLDKGMTQFTVPAYHTIEKGMEKWLTRQIQSAKARHSKKSSGTGPKISSKKKTQNPPSAVKQNQSSNEDSKCEEEPELNDILPINGNTTNSDATKINSDQASSSMPVSPSPALMDPIVTDCNSDSAATMEKDAPSSEQDESASSMGESAQRDDEDDEKSPPAEEEVEEVPRFIPTNNYCLSEDQIKLCMEATMEHFDAVMRTVKARDLTRELVDGFDLLRERGRGRYDMTIPAFDTKNFNFLNDIKKAPWMPIVKQVLGKDVVLIHKGCFLSNPGAANQRYHQDGPHLHTTSQRPCHAVNVFIPLVDMTMKHGPTEFCVGSHVLGQEDWDKRYIETPLQKKGVPVMFDYRLGHRGLANTSKDSRPVVYATYARAGDGKEFQDNVNFSSKRYRKLGDLIDKPMSREERNRKRREATECWQDFPEAFVVTENS